MKTNPKLSIAIPMYNEEEGIPNLYEKLTELEKALDKEKISREFILINDGSKDKTLELLNKYFGKKKNVKIITHEKNLNIGGGIRTAVKNFEGELLGFLDSDCTYDPIILIDMVKMINGFDIVTASPYHPDGKVENASFYRIFLSKGVTLLYSIILDSKIHTYTSFVRVYKRDVIKNINFESNNFIGVTEILVYPILNKSAKVGEYPTILKGRIYGVSKIKVINVIKQHLKLLFKLLKLRVLNKKAI